MWQELNKEDTTTSFHYLLRAGQILITVKSLDKISDTVQPFQICRNIEDLCEDHRIFPSVPGSVTKHTLLLHWHWQRVDALSSAEIQPLNVDQGSPGLRMCCWGDSHRRASALELVSPVLAACPQYSMFIAISKKKKILLFYLNFLLPLWNSSPSSPTQTCKKWFFFFLMSCLWDSLMK